MTATGDPAALRRPRAARAADRARFEELEPRLLYSADNPGAWLAGTALPSAVVQVVPSAVVPAVPAAVATPVYAPAPVASARELVFIDAGVQPTQALLDGLRAARPAAVDLQVVQLQPGIDGLQQISQTLAQHQGLAAVHVVAHGEAAALQLGSVRLDATALASRSAELQAWRAALADDADLLLYGCDVAAGDSGAAFIQHLAVLTGADVAASTNATGAAAAGGDWVLEAQVGTVTAQAAAQPLQQALAGTLGLLPAAAEQRVNTDATGTQLTSIYGGGNVAMDTNGNRVVVWNDARTNSGDVYFQRYDAAGVAQGANTLVNTTTVNQQGDAQVAMDANGNFVVVWASDGQDGGSWGIYAQRFNAAGTALGGEFQVHTTTAGAQISPTVAMADNGAFVIAWTDGSSGTNEVKAQRYNSSGVAQGGEIAVNTTTTNAQQFPSVAMATNGDFVVAWESDQSTDWGIYLQRFNAAGAPQGGEVVVNSFIAGTQWNPAVAADSAGNFVVVWGSLGQDPGGSAGIYAQRYNAAGVTQGAEFRVNTTTVNDQTVPAVAMNAAGGFVVSWNSDLQDGSGSGVYAQAYDAGANALGGELRVASTTTGNQQTPAVAYRGGRALVAWSGEGTGDAQGVFMQQLQVTDYNLVVVENASDVADGDTSSITALYNNKGADGTISLREALLAANNTPNALAGPDRIEFDISGAGPHTIQPASALPTITDAVLLDATTSTDFVANSNRPVVVLDGNNLAAHGLTLGATADGSTIRGLVIRDFAGDAIRVLAGSDNNWITGNYLGSLTASGTDAGAAEANTGSGIYVTSGVVGTLVGGSGAGQGNVMSGNQWDGMDSFGTGMVVQGNFIGTDASGTVAIGNAQDGISLAGNNNLVGGTGANEGNLIAYNTRHGSDPWNTATGNRFLGNRIFANGGLAIDLGLNGVTANDAGDADTGANNLQNFPVLATARTNASNQVIVTGALNSTANSFFRIEFFANTSQDGTGFGEGETYLGFANVATDGAGNATISTTLTASVPVGRFISATATRATDGTYATLTDTSEFARNIAAVDSAQATVTVDTSSDVSDGDTTSLSTLLANKGADGFISLREAITAANNTTNGSGGADRIQFAIGLGDAGFTGTNGVDGRWVLTLASALPTITNSVVIDATTQTTAVANSNPGTLGSGGTVGTDALALGTVNRPEVEVVGSSAMATAFNIAASDVTLRGFAIRGVGSVGNDAAILVGNNHTGTLIEHNVLGTAATGFVDPGVGQRNFRHLVINGADTGVVQNNLFGYSVSNAVETANGANNWLISNNELRDSGIEVNGADALAVGNASSVTVQRNLITGTSGQGVVAGSGSSGITVVNNTVSNSGTGITGFAPSQTSAVAFRTTVSAVTVERNIITDSFGAGVAVNDGAVSVRISQNSIFNSGTVTSRNGTAASGQVGIDLGAVGDNGFIGTAPYVTPNDAGDADAGANNLQNFPVLASARTNASNQFIVTGTLNSNANGFYRIEFFANTSQDGSGFGEGQTYLGFANVATDGSGNAPISQTLTANVPVGAFISATATRASDGTYTSFTDTSEFARNIATVDSTQATVAVDSTSDVSDGDTSSISTLLANKGADGFISLREALAAANNTANGSSPDRIVFNIAGTGVHTLTPLTVLPTITDAVVLDASIDDSFAANGNRPAIVLDGNDGAFDGLVLGATADGSTVRGLVVRDFGGSSIWMQAGSDNHSIVGNYLGALDSTGQWVAGEATGLSALNIQGSGITVGGTLATARNVIAGAGFSGIWFDTGSGNTVLGNYIGLAADGSTVIGNGWDGITIDGGSGHRIGGVLVGEGNRIAGASDDGINVVSGTGHSLLGNTITGSISMGIDLGPNNTVVTPNDAGDADSGANNLQNYPELTSARTDGSSTLVLMGSLNSEANTAYRIEFFANTAAHAIGHGEGQRYLGFAHITTNGSGLATINTTLAAVVAPGESISATATRADAGFTLFSDTSEFALNVPATLEPVVTTSGTPLAYTENDTATPVDAALVVSDGDSASLAGATVSISGNYASGQDVLAFSNLLGITGSWNAGTGVLTLSGSASVANYQTALRSITYFNSSDNPSTLTRSISFVVNDGTGPSVVASRSITVAAVNDAPAVVTTGSTLVVAENDAATPVDAGLTVSDPDTANLSGASVSITTGYGAGEDLLLFTDQLGISGSWNAGTGVLTLSGTASVADYQAALRSVRYLNTSEAPSTALRTVSFDATDGLLTGSAATRSLQVNAVNDAPVLDNTAALQLTTITRVDTTNSGNTVAQVIGSASGDRITDVDSAALEGVALTATSTGGIGQWQYSLDGGSSWQPVGSVSVGAALLLRDTDRLRFVPSGVANGLATVTFRAWDRTTGVAGSTADASTAGGTSAFSANFESAAINVVENNSGPVAVADNANTPAGVPVGVNVLSNDLDPQGDPLQVLDVSNPANGSASVGGGGTVNYTPNGGFSGNDSFNYVVRDANDGLASYWKLDGNGADSVGPNSGTALNGPNTVPGPYGNALQFDGVDDRVQLPDVAYSNEFTLSFRFRVDSNSGNEIQYFYSHGAVPTSGQANAVHVGLVEDNNAQVGQRNHLITTVFDGNDVADGAGQVLVDVASLIGDGQWHQFTLTVTPGVGTQVFVDGVLRASVNRGGDNINPSGNALLGARSDLEPTRYLNAGSRMDSVALFNRALSSTEVASFFSGGANQATVTVHVNATPVVTTSGGSATFVENGAPLVVDAGLLVSDANSAQLVGATVSISGNFVPGQDSLQFNNQLGITGSWNAGTGQLTLSGTASVASYQTALRSVTYLNSSDAPDTTTRVLSYTVDDGLATSTAATRNVVVTAVNDSPTASNLSTAETYTEDTLLNLTDIVVNDVDNASGSVTLTLSNPAAGALGTATSGAVTSSYNPATGVWVASGALVDVNTLLANLSFTPALNFNGNFSIATSVSDGVAAPLTGSKAFTGVPVNDAPTASNLNAAENFTEDTPLNLVDMVVADVDNASLAVTLTLSDAAAGTLSTATAGAVTSTFNPATGVWSASGAVADVNTLLAGLVFMPANNYTSNLTLTTSVSDGLAAPVTGSKALTVTLVNDAPTGSHLNTAETTAEDTPLNLTDTVVADVDHANLTVTLTLSNPAAGALSIGTAGAVTANYNAATGVWTASGAVADVNTLLASLNFLPAAHYNGSFSIATSVSDGVAAPVLGSKPVVVTPVNDAPTASNLSAPETYTEDTVLNLADIVAADIDSSGGSVTLTLSNPAVGTLSTGTAGAVTSTFNPATGVWLASGNWADVNTLLAALVFTPTADFNGSFSLATAVNDGVAAPVTGSKLFSGVPVNDAPTATQLNAPETYVEDQALNLTDIVTGDIDSANLTATLTLSNPAVGTLSTGTVGAVTSTFNPATGVWVASGAWGDVNSLLAGLSFVPAADFNGSFSLSTHISDGVAPALTGIKAFTGVPVNDAPTASNLSAPETYTEDTVLNLADLVAADNDSSGGSVTLTLSNPAVGSLNTGTAGAVTSTFNPATGVWLASGNWADVNTLLAALVFTPAPHFNGGFSLATAVNDGVAAPVTGSKAFTGVPVNDAPTATQLNAPETYVEDQTLNLTDIVTGDIDSANLTATLTLSNPAVGTLSTGTVGAVTAAFNPATGVWTASGAWADVNSLLAALSFVPAADFNGAFSIATSVSDGVAPALTGSKAFTGVPVNDAPTGSNLSAPETYTEDTVLNLADIVAADIDSSGGSVTLTLSNPAVGTLSTGTAGAVTSTFNPATGVWLASGNWADVNTLLAALVFTPTADFNGSFSVATAVNDGVAAPVTGSKAFTGVPVNDAPTATPLSAPETYVEDQALNLTDIVTGDIDSANLTATLTLSNPAVGTLSTGTADAVTSTFNPATGVWVASGAWADVNSLLAGLSFVPAADFNGSFSLSTHISDGVAPALTGSKLFTGVPVNDAPTASGLDTAKTYTEDTPLNLADVTVGDIDSATLSVRLTLSNPAAGAFSTGSAGGVTAAFDAATGVWSASGAVAGVNSLLAAVQFMPALNFNGNFDLATWVSDGVAAPLTGIKAFTGVAVNDAPVLVHLGSLAVAEGSTTVLGAAQLQATDVDNGPAQLRYTLLTVPAHGSVLLGGVALPTGGAFTQADVDAGLVAYRHDSSETTADGLDFGLSDGAATGGDGGTGRLVITIAPVNDEVPQFTGAVAVGAVSVPENSTAVTRATAVDADLPAPTLRYDIVGGADASAFSIDSSSGELVFARAPDHEAPLDADRDNVYRVDVRVSDGELSSTRSMAVTLLPENDNTPQLTSGGGQAQVALEVQEGSPSVLTVAAADADQPAPALVYSIAGGADAALFVVDADTGALRFAQAPQAIAPRDRDGDNVYQVVVQASDGSRLVQQLLSVRVRGSVQSLPMAEMPLTQGPALPLAMALPGAAAPAAAADAPNAAPATAAPSAPPTPSAEPVVASLEPFAPLPSRASTGFSRLDEGVVQRSRDDGGSATAASAAAAAANAFATGSLEAALGLPVDADGLQPLQLGGTATPGLGAAAAVRSSTAGADQVTPAPLRAEAQREWDGNDFIVEALASPVVAGGMALSTTLLLWATRAGGLAAAMMASIPAWRSLDPLPILARSNERQAEDDDPQDAEAVDDQGLQGASGASAGPEEQHRGPADRDPPFGNPDDPANEHSPPRRPPPAALRELIEPLEMLR